MTLRNRELKQTGQYHWLHDPDASETQAWRNHWRSTNYQIPLGDRTGSTAARGRSQVKLNIFLSVFDSRKNLENWLRRNHAAGVTFNFFPFMCDFLKYDFSLKPAILFCIGYRKGWEEALLFENTTQIAYWALINVKTARPWAKESLLNSILFRAIKLNIWCKQAWVSGLHFSAVH